MKKNDRRRKFLTGASLTVGGAALLGSSPPIRAHSAGQGDVLFADTIENMRDLNPVSNDLLVYVSGHTTANDSGGGLFYAKTGTTAGTYTDDNGVTILPNGGDGRSAWIRERDPDISVSWYGIFPNDETLRSQNTDRLVALLDPDQAGVTGRVAFDNVTGADTYYFDGVVAIRDNITLDLNGCTLDFTKDYGAGEDFLAFLMAIRNVTIENGSINIDYVGADRRNAGQIIRLGARPGYRFGAFLGNEDALSEPMGGVSLRNLNLSSNNSGTYGVLLLGGLHGVSIEDVRIDGNGALRDAIYYEYGALDHSYVNTTHARNLSFTNVQVRNLDANLQGRAGIQLVGPRDANIRSLMVDSAGAAIIVRPGEATYYRVAGADQMPGNRHLVNIENVVGTSLQNYGMQLLGANDASLGYLGGK